HPIQPRPHRLSAQGPIVIDFGRIWRMNLHIAFALVIPMSVAFAAAPDTVFEQKIQPVLSANCQACHSSKTKTSGFSIANAESVIAGGNKHGRAVIAGNPAASPLI